VEANAPRGQAVESRRRKVAVAGATHGARPLLVSENVHQIRPVIRLLCSECGTYGDQHWQNMSQGNEKALVQEFFHGVLQFG